MFRIDGTDFKIDTKKSRFKVWSKKSGVTIDAEIYGDPAHYEKITEDEDSRWSWTLYPPHFYIRSFPGKPGRIEGRVNAKVSLSDLEEHEVAIYLIEHNDVDAVSVTVDDTVFQAKGTVFLSGKPRPFSIKFQR